MTLPWDTVEPTDVPLSRDDQCVVLPAERQASTSHSGAVHTDPLLEPIIIVGAGLAGCWLARQLAARGIYVRVIDRHAAAGSGASANPAGIVKPFVTRAPNAAMHFHVAAYAHLLNELQSLPPGEMGCSEDYRLQACGVVQLVEQAYPPATHYRSLDKASADAVAGVTVNSRALLFADAGWLNPGALCRALIQHPRITLELDVQLTGFDDISIAGPPCWQLSLSNSRARWTRRLVLACGPTLHRFAQTSELPIVAARGQLSRFRLKDKSRKPLCVINGKHYVIPEDDCVLVGATFDREVLDDAVAHADHARNLAGLHATVAGLQVDPVALQGYAGVRATTPDRLPIAGPVPDLRRAAAAYADLRHGRAIDQIPSLPCVAGLYTLGGLGSRGIVTAPLAASALADLLMDTRLGIWQSWAPLLNPVRFLIRDLKRGRQRNR